MLFFAIIWGGESVHEGDGIAMNFNIRFWWRGRRLKQHLHKGAAWQLAAEELAACRSAMCSNGVILACGRGNPMRRSITVSVTFYTMPSNISPLTRRKLYGTTSQQRRDSPGPPSKDPRQTPQPRRLFPNATGARGSALHPQVRKAASMLAARRLLHSAV